MQCLKFDSKIGSEEWKRQPTCDCINCQIFFAKLRETHKTGIPLMKRMEQLADNG